MELKLAINSAGSNDSLIDAFAGNVNGRVAVKKACARQCHGQPQKKLLQTLLNRVAKTISRLGMRERAEVFVTQCHLNVTICYTFARFVVA